MSVVRVSPTFAWWLRIIGAAEAGPAAYLLVAALSSGRFGGHLWAIAFLYAFLISSVYFGVSLLRLQRASVIGSIVIQACQVLLAENDFFTWRVQLTGFLGPALAGDILGPRLELGPRIVLRGLADPPQILIGVNLLAVGAIALLSHALSSRPASAPSIPERSSA